MFFIDKPGEKKNAKADKLISVTDINRHVSLFVTKLKVHNLSWGFDCVLTDTSKKANSCSAESVGFLCSLVSVQFVLRTNNKISPVSVSLTRMYVCTLI